MFAWFLNRFRKTQKKREEPFVDTLDRRRHRNANEHFYRGARTHRTSAATPSPSSRPHSQSDLNALLFSANYEDNTRRSSCENETRTSATSPVVHSPSSSHSYGCSSNRHSGGESYHSDSGGGDSGGGGGGD